MEDFTFPQTAYFPSIIEFGVIEVQFTKLLRRGVMAGYNNNNQYFVDLEYLPEHFGVSIFFTRIEALKSLRERLRVIVDDVDAQINSELEKSAQI